MYLFSFFLDIIGTGSKKEWQTFFTKLFIWIGVLIKILFRRLGADDKHFSNLSFSITRVRITRIVLIRAFEVFLVEHHRKFSKISRVSRGVGCQNECPPVS